jgi:Fe-S cluster biogenesis protein NfuA
MQSPTIEEKILETLVGVRPYLQQDGGDVELVDFSAQTGILRLRLTGACKTCPMSTMTLRAGIERVLRKAIPEIKRVEAVQ